MKILHLHSGSLNSGAGRGVVALHQSLVSRGIDSTIYSNDDVEFSQKRKIALQILSFLVKVKNHFITLLLKSNKNSDHLITIASRKLIDLNNSKLREADIIHLHWVVDLKLLDSLRNLRKPVVWTLRDFYPFTAVCHYPMACKKFEEGCSGCPAVSKFSQEIAQRRYECKYKFNSEANVTWVGISHYISDMASKSHMINGLTVNTIHNHANVVRSKLSYQAARKLFSVSDGFIHIVYGCQNLLDPYKGVEIFIECMFKLFKIGVPIRVSLYGANAQKLKSKYGKRLGSNFVFLGLIGDDEYLADLYKSSDVFLGASVQDAFSKTLVEAACNGSYIITSKNIGALEILTKYKNKTIVNEPSLNEFSNALMDFYDKYKNNEIHKDPFLYDSTDSTEKYIKIYKKLTCRS